MSNEGLCIKLQHQSCSPSRRISVSGCTMYTYRSPGTVYYIKPRTVKCCALSNAPIQPSTGVVPHRSLSSGKTPATNKVVGEVVSIGWQNLFPVFKVKPCDGNQFQCWEWFDQFHAAVDSAILSALAALAESLENSSNWHG